MNNNNSNINSLLRIKFPISIQNDVGEKFKFKVFHTKNHDTYKYRNLILIDVVNISDPDATQYGYFRKSDLNWILHIPKLDNFNIEELIKHNEVLSTFVKNLRDDIGEKGPIKPYQVIANIYESLPKCQYTNNINFIFFKIFAEKQMINSYDSTIQPTFCYLAQKLSQPIDKCSDVISTLYLSNSEEEIKNNKNLKLFMEEFTHLIKNKSYNYLKDIFNAYWEYKNPYNDLSKIKYDKRTRDNAINLINRCQIDDNAYFIYSNLGTRFFDSISKLLLINSDPYTKKFLFNIVKI